ncbi:substrate-binding domain-containing protein [Roseococcus sp. SYP-B2431]|uniref:substrate-binding domain-containing protein n=1 Tax=Roseococcus sp. SYP-B2431 TaxID=2496640 RepID=UPI00198209E2|nr:substrate-binding domain-containing protein [Roseococcus sp. SYP-B2431]
MLRRRFLLSTGLLLAASRARAAGTTLHVMTSGAFTAPYRILGPAFEAATGHRLESAYGASMGNAPDAIPQRLARGEPADVVILARSALDALVRAGQVRAGSEVDLVESRIAMAVRAGAPHPRIGTVEEFREAMLNARSIGYSASASGVYFATELLQRLGIAEQILPRTRRILSERVGAVVARGEIELGFQQVSELLPIPGIEIVGPLPAPIQRVTTFSAGIATRSEQPQSADALIRFFASAAAHEVIRRAGLDPLGATTN